MLKLIQLASSSCASLALLLSACSDPEQPLGDAGPITPPPGLPSEISAFDVLFVIDNSGSMATEQEKLAVQLPRLVQILVTGDKYVGDPTAPAVPAAQRYFKPVSSLHLGVVSTNMGGVEGYAGPAPALQSCNGLGDDGKLQNSTRVAVEGVVAGGLDRNPEFAGHPPGAIVLPPEPTCELGALPLYQTYEAGTGDPLVRAAELAHVFRCTSRLGVRGCPFEQPLEAMWKALAPHDGRGDLFRFRDGTSGHGDVFNRDFLRPDAALAVVHVTDEDDCSITDAGHVVFELGQAAEDTYGPINLRCNLYANDHKLVHATKRYVDGLLALKPGHPERVFFGAIVGIPVSAADLPLEAVLALPEMQFREQEPGGDVPNRSGVPVPSCTVPDATKPEQAYPPRRIVEVARSFGERTTVSSICASDFRPAVDKILGKMAEMMGPAIVPEPPAAPPSP